VLGAESSRKAEPVAGGVSDVFRTAFSHVRWLVSVTMDLNDVGTECKRTDLSEFVWRPACWGLSGLRKKDRGSG